MHNSDSKSSSNEYFKLGDSYINQKNNTPKSDISQW